MVQLTEDFEVVEIKVDSREDQSHDRRMTRVRQHSRPPKVKKTGNWKRGMHQRRNKRFAW